MKYKNTLYDLSYDVGADDWEVSGGDLVFNTTHTEHLDQLLLDAFESQFNSMKFIQRNWGFEGRGDDYQPKDNEVYQKAYLYITEILHSVSFLILNIQAVTPDFPGTSNTFNIRIECILNDGLETSYDKTLTWDGATNTATIV